MNKLSLPLVNLIIFYISSCDTVENNKPDVKYFHARVDSLLIPDSVGATDTIYVRLKGYLGENTCYYFSHFEISEIERGTTIKVWGRHVLNTPCIEIFIGFDEIHKIYNLRTGYFLIKVLNPDNQNIIDSVWVY